MSSSPVPGTRAARIRRWLPAAAVSLLLPTVALSNAAVAQASAATASDSTAPKATATNCATKPSKCGYPDATNTGVTVATSKLRIINGPVDLHQDGQVFENAIVRGHVNIAASNVTVRNVRIRNTGEDWGIGLVHARNATISHAEIRPAGARLVVGIKDVYGDARGTRILRTEIVRTATGIQTHEGLIRSNYIHDMAYAPGDHVNGTTSNGSTVPLTIRHNTIFNQLGQTDAISLFQDFGVEANRTIHDNLLAGGGYSIYGGAGGHGTTHHIEITDNRFSRLYYPNGGSYGPVAHFDGGRGNKFSGNVWDENAARIARPAS